MSLTAAQLTDVRRFLGYPLNGTTMTITNDQDTVYMRFGMATMSLQARLTNLSASEELTLTTIYLANLYTLETAIFGASANLDTDEASVWKHNKNEVDDRIALCNKTRRMLCGFIGIEPGAGLGNGALMIARG